MTATGPLTGTNTTSADLSAAITFKVQKGVLENLRASLVFADKRFAEEGSFDSGTDTLMFINVPDIAINVTPLTEGVPPTVRSLSIGTVTVSAIQYGDLVGITDLAKVKSPVEIVPIAIERVSRQAAESLDQVNRDVIAAGGTTKLIQVDSVNAVRADIASTELMKVAALRRLKSQMFKAKVRPRDDGFYLLWVHENVAFDLKNEATSTTFVAGSFNDVNKYTDKSNLIKGEIGSLEGFRIMSVVNAPTFSSTTTVYRSIALGDKKAWGCGDLQTLQTAHVAAKMGADHFDPLGQMEYVGWKVSYGVAVLNNGYYFALETAATSA